MFFLITGIYLCVLEKPLDNFNTITINDVNSISTSKTSVNYINNESNLNTYVPPDLTKAVPVILGMLVLTVILGAVMVILIAKYPRCVIYTMGVLVIGLIVVIAILLFAAGSAIGGILVLAIAAIFITVFYCVRNSLDTGIALLKVSGQFLTEKPLTFLAPFFVGILVLIFLVFWVLSLVSIELNRPDQTNNVGDDLAVQDILLTIWSLILIFFMFFFYYVMVFLIATACALWFFGMDRNYLTTGLGWITKAHLGSLTFASLLITIITIIKNFIDQKTRRATASLNG